MEDKSTYTAGTNYLAEELRDNPELVEELLATAGKIGLASLAARLTVIHYENKDRDTLIAAAKRSAELADRKFEALEERTRKAIGKLNARIKALEKK